jgi:dsRNA-specific ribonuclease
VENQFRERLRCANRTRYETDFKSMLQERVQSIHHEVPRYEVLDEIGPDHDKTFRVQMTVAGITAQGDGKSKKMAEQEAARAGLDLLDRSA